MGDSVTEASLGPERCCSSMCLKSGQKCGGKMDFSGGRTRECYSVYCVPNEKDENAEERVSA